MIERRREITLLADTEEARPPNHDFTSTRRRQDQLDPDKTSSRTATSYRRDAQLQKTWETVAEQGHDWSFYPSKR